MARPNAASRGDLMGAFQAGVSSVSGKGPVPKPSADAGDIHDNKTSGAGVFVKKPKRSVAARKKHGSRTPGK